MSATIRIVKDDTKPGVLTVVCDQCPDYEEVVRDAPMASLTEAEAHKREHRLYDTKAETGDDDEET